LDTTALPVQLTIATDRFEAELPSRQTTPLLAPLGHDVVGDGPAGVIGGLLTPLGTPQPSDGGVDLAVARKAPPAGAGRATPSQWVAQRITSGDEPAPTAATGDDPPAPAPPAPLGQQTPPVWRVPAVDGPPPSSPGLTAARRPEALPVVQLTALETPTPAETSTSSGPPPAEPPAESAPLLAEQPAGPTLEAPTVSRLAEGTAELPSASSPIPATPPGIPAMPDALAQPRRLGLGAPLPAVPGSKSPAISDTSVGRAASVQRTADAAPQPAFPVVTPERLNPARPETPPPSNEAVTVPLLASPTSADEVPAGLLSSLTGPGGEAIGSADGPAPDSPALPVAVQRVISEPMVAHTPVRPVLAGRPIGPTALQRAVDGPPAARPAEPPLTAPPQTKPASATPPPRPATGGLTVQRSATPAAPGPASGTPVLHHAPSPEATPSAIAHAALSSGTATLDADGAVVFAPPAWAEPGPMAIQRALDEPALPAPSLPSSSELPAAATATAAPATGTLATAAAGGAAAAAAAGLPVDELAARLYDRIHDRLRAEFRLDRERRGRVTDLAR
jgi:hypothetical protein